MREREREAEGGVSRLEVNCPGKEGYVLRQQPLLFLAWRRVPKRLRQDGKERPSPINLANLEGTATCTSGTKINSANTNGCILKH